MNIIAVERDVSRARWHRGLVCLMLMATHLSLGKIENEPTASDICARETELVANESPEFLGLRRVKHCVYTCDHRIISFPSCLTLKIPDEPKPPFGSSHCWTLLPARQIKPK